MFVKFCKDCIWSSISKSSDWELRCLNPIVNATNSYALSRTSISYEGTHCHVERDKGFFSFPKCGMKGKLWKGKKIGVNNEHTIG